MPPSAVYSLTNRSIYSNNIVQLLDGVPQKSIVNANQYNFYNFTPPAAG